MRSPALAIIDRGPGRTRSHLMRPLRRSHAVVACSGRTYAGSATRTRRRQNVGAGHSKGRGEDGTQLQRGIPLHANGPGLVHLALNGGDKEGRQGDDENGGRDGEELATLHGCAGHLEVLPAHVARLGSRVDGELDALEAWNVRVKGEEVRDALPQWELVEGAIAGAPGVFGIKLEGGPDRHGVYAPPPEGCAKRPPVHASSSLSSSVLGIRTITACGMAASHWVRLPSWTAAGQAPPEQAVCLRWSTTNARLIRIRIRPWKAATARAREDRLRARIDGLLQEFSLSALGVVIAKKWLEKIADPKDQRFGRLRQYVLNHLNGRRRPQHGISPWQHGCPELIPGLRAAPVWDSSSLPWLAHIERHAHQIRSELLALRGRRGFQPLRIPAWATKAAADAADGKGRVSHDSGDWNVFYLALHEVRA